MSPFLYALFIVSLLEDLLALGVTEGLEVGAADWHRVLTEQAYADDLSDFASNSKREREGEGTRQGTYVSGS